MSENKNANWVRFSKAASMMGITVQGAYYKFKKLDNAYDGQLIRKNPGCPSEISIRALKEILETERLAERDEQFSEMRLHLKDLDVKVLSLRESFRGIRKRVGVNERNIQRLKAATEALCDFEQ